MSFDIHEKSPLRSKKFVAFLVSEITWKIAIGAVILVAGTNPGIWIPIVLAIIIVAGFIEAAYIGGQAVLDKYVRVAHVAVSGATSMVGGRLPGLPSSPDELSSNTDEMPALPQEGEDSSSSNS